MNHNSGSQTIFTTSVCRAISSLLGFTITFTLLTMAVSPWSFMMPENFLDPSWMAVLNEAFSKGWAWGKDIAFTYGPYGFLILRQFHPETWGHHIIFWTSLTFFFSLVFLYCFKGLPVLLKISLIYSLLLAVYQTYEPLFFSIPLIISLYLKPEKPLRDNLLIFPLAVLSGIGVLIKFSFAPFPLLTYLILDIFLLSKRRYFFLTPIFLLAMVFGFFWLNFSLKDFFLYLVLSYEVSQAYGVAMQGTGSAAVFLCFYGGVFLLLIHFILWKGKCIFRLDNMIVFLSFILGLFIVQKAGFVRNGGQALPALNTLLLFTIIYTAYAWPQINQRGKRVLLIFVLLINQFLTLYGTRAIINIPVFDLALKHLYQTESNSLVAFKRFASSPHRYITDLNEQYRVTLNQISSTSSLSNYEGTVDIIPSKQTEVIAKHLNYRPRPIFQSYSVYSPRLINQNKAFFRSKQAPQFLIFGIDEIDGRYPGSGEGGSWLEFFRLYEPYDTTSNYLVLKKRARQIPVSVSPFEKRRVSFGESLALSDGNKELIWAKIEFSGNFLETLLRLTYKTPPIYAEVVLESGESETYRILPTVSEMGQLLSPIIKNHSDFLNIYNKIPLLENNRIKSVTFKTSDLGRFIYPYINISLFKVQIS